MNNSDTNILDILSVVHRGLLLALLFFVIASASSAAAEVGYVEIGRTDEYIDSLLITSVEKRESYGNEYIVGWLKTIIRKPEQREPIKGKKPSYFMSLVAANTGLKQIQTLSFAYYDKDGKVLLSDTRPFATFRWEDCIPNTLGETSWYAIMGTFYEINK